MKEYKQALAELVEECEKEFARGNEQYGESWKETGPIVHLYAAVNDAIKLKGIDPNNTKALKHRITDIVNYLTFVWAELP